MVTSPRIMGVDVSSHQGMVNWHQLKAAGNKFAAIKSTEGVGYQDPFFFRNWQNAYNHQLLRFAYHYLHANIDGAEQADYLHANVYRNGKFRVGDGVLLDLENLDGLPVENAKEQAERFIIRARQSIYKQVVLYTYVAFWQQMGEPLSPVLASCPLWLADYGVLIPPRLKNLPSPAFWQFSSTGIEQGVDGPVDLDLFYGSLADLQLLLKFPAPVLPPLPPSEPPETIPSGQFGKFGANPSAAKMQ